MAHELHRVDGQGRRHHVRLTGEVGIHVLGLGGGHRLDVGGEVAGAAEGRLALPIAQDAVGGAGWGKDFGQDETVQVRLTLDVWVEPRPAEAALVHFRRKHREEDALALATQLDDLCWLGWMGMQAWQTQGEQHTTHTVWMAA